MTRCNRCGRALKFPRPSGYGETCERYVLGSKPKRAAAVEHRPVKRDDRTPDMFEVRG